MNAPLCIACEGTGVSSKGRPCSPCAGSGRKRGGLRPREDFVDQTKVVDRIVETASTSPFVFDCETARIRPGCQLPPLTCVAVEQDGSVHLLDHVGGVAAVAAMLSSGNQIVGHNVAFDFGVIAAEEPALIPHIFDAYEEGRVSDTMIRQKLIDIAEGKYRRFFRKVGKAVKIGYGLDDLAYRLLGLEVPKDNEVRLGYGPLRGVPIEQWEERFRAYAMTDVAVTAALWRYQDEHPRWVRYLPDESRQCAAAWWIQLMGAWGLRTDPEGVEEFERELQEDFDQKAALLREHGLLRENGVRDTKAAKARMVEICKERDMDVAMTAKGNVQLSADHCEATGDEVLEAYAGLSSLSKQLNTDIPLLRRGTRMPIHPRFETLLTTGRTSSSPNVQNLPVYGKMRECFVPREGYVFAGADYDGFELRTMSQACVKMFGSSRLAEALNAGLDPHLVVASQILKIGYEEAAERHARDDDEVYRARQTAKVAGFGFPGGLGFKKLVIWAKKAYDVDLTEDEARRLKEDWLAAWPEFHSFFGHVAQACDRPDLETESARIEQVFSGRIRGDITFTEGCNTLFQGLAADCAKLAGFLIARACYAEPKNPLYGSRIVNFVHDEFIVEAPEERAPEAAEELARLMVKGALVFLPDVPPKASPYLMRRWYKKAKPVRDENGRLMPWEP